MSAICKGVWRWTFSCCDRHRKPKSDTKTIMQNRSSLTFCDVEWVIWTSHNVCTLHWRWHRILLHSTKTSFSLQYLLFQICNYLIMKFIFLYKYIYIKLAMIIHSFFDPTLVVYSTEWTLYFGFNGLKLYSKAGNLKKMVLRSHAFSQVFLLFWIFFCYLQN